MSMNALEETRRMEQRLASLSAFRFTWSRLCSEQTARLKAQETPTKKTLWEPKYVKSSVEEGGSMEPSSEFTSQAKVGPATLASCAYEEVQKEDAIDEEDVFEFPDSNKDGTGDDRDEPEEVSSPKKKKAAHHPKGKAEDNVGSNFPDVPQSQGTQMGVKALLHLYNGHSGAKQNVTSKAGRRPLGGKPQAQISPATTRGSAKAADKASKSSPEGKVGPDSARRIRRLSYKAAALVSQRSSPRISSKRTSVRAPVAQSLRETSSAAQDRIRAAGPRKLGQISTLAAQETPKGAAKRKLAPSASSGRSTRSRGGDPQASVRRSARKRPKSLHIELQDEDFKVNKRPAPSSRSSGRPKLPLDEDRAKRKRDAGGKETRRSELSTRRTADKRVHATAEVPMDSGGRLSSSHHLLFLVTGFSAQERRRLYDLARSIKGCATSDRLDDAVASSCRGKGKSVIVIAHPTSKYRLKYMCALAAGWPVLHCMWLKKAAASGDKLPDMCPYKLPAGVDRNTGCPVEAPSQETHQCFRSHHAAVVHGQTTVSTDWAHILKFAGAKNVAILSYSPSFAEEITKLREDGALDIVVYDGQDSNASRIVRAVKSLEGLHAATTDWVAQCLVNGYDISAGGPDTTGADATVSTSQRVRDEAGHAKRFNAGDAVRLKDGREGCIESLFVGTRRIPKVKIRFFEKVGRGGSSNNRVRKLKNVEVASASCIERQLLLLDEKMAKKVGFATDKDVRFLVNKQMGRV
jgi:hypothetical protein